MRTKRNWFIIAMTVIMAGSLTGCMEKGQNITPFNGYPSFMTTKGGNYYMECLAGNVYVSGLSSITSNPFELDGTFGISAFDINYDEQPAGTDGDKVPYTATIKLWVPVADDLLQISDGELPYYSDTIVYAQLYISDLFKNCAFFGAVENTPANSSYRYHLTLNLDSTAKQGIPALYLQTERTSSGSGSPQNTPYYSAFNMSEIMSNTDYKEDVKLGGVDCEQVKFNLYYQTGVDKTGKPIFSEPAKTSENPGNPYIIYRVKP